MSLRSCQIETTEPVQGTTIGAIPKWLKGTLMKNSAGMFKIGDDSYKHFFDGLALLHTFKISDGSVTYFNKFLRSDRYKRNTSANRIVLGEFGTKVCQDPCKTVWGRSNTSFSTGEDSDNCNAGFCPYNDETYAVTETKYIWKLDPKTFNTLEKIDLSKYVAINHATSHPHVDKNGTIWNIGNSYNGQSFYNIVRFPPLKKEKNSTVSSFDQATILASIPSRWLSRPGYYHSFSITENYIVLIEQPFVISSTKDSTNQDESANTDLHWYPDQKAVFYVIHKTTGVAMKQKYVSSVSFTFYHTINAYEEESHIVLDLCAYENGNFVKAFYLEPQNDYDPNKCLHDKFAKAWRFVLPLKLDNGLVLDQNLVTLKETTCTALPSPDEAEAIICTHELFKDIWCELPTINYDYNGKKYQYFYTFGADGSLMKMNWKNHSIVSWKDENYWPTAPTFVSKPNASREDEGVVLSVLVNPSALDECTLVVLDAETFTELGRSSFTTNDTVPLMFHGMFVSTDKETQ